MSLAVYPILHCKPGAVSTVATALESAIKGTFTEPGALAYYFFTSEKEADRIYAFEVYADKAANKHHAESQHFKTFGKAVGSSFAKPLEIHVGRNVDVGFYSRDTESAAEVMSDRSCTAVLAFIECKSAEHATKVIELARSFAEDVVRKTESGTLAYHWSIDARAPEKVYVFERYKDQSAIKTHMANAREFSKSLTPLVKQTKLVFGKPIGGFLKKDAGLVGSSVL